MSTQDEAKSISASTKRHKSTNSSTTNLNTAALTDDQVKKLKTEEDVQICKYKSMT
jgi:hypothetical protein